MRSLLCFFLACVAFAHADCPSGYTPMPISNTHYCYKIYTTFYDRQQAVTQCAQDGATLATISNANENAVYVNADQMTGSLTFGLSCIDSNRCAFDDGTPYNSSSFNGFTGGQPNANLGGCVALETVGVGAGKWSNIPCTLYGSFVCRFDQNSIISRQSGCNSLYILTASTTAFTITSPQYPRNYDNSETCSYFIQSNNRVNITFTDFYTENGPDVVRIYDGGYRRNATLIGQYSGSPSAFTVLSQGSDALITFTTDISVTYRGFSATVRTV